MSRPESMNPDEGSTTVEEQIPTEDIARRAYELWEARGCPPGDGSEDWNAAVAELTARRNSAASGLRHWWQRWRRSIGRRGR